MKTLSVILFMMFGFATGNSTPKSDLCRISCTITITTAYYTLSVTESAGGLFVSCETAGERACDRAYNSAMEMLAMQ